MPSNQHSALGASSAERWMACPGSIRKLKELPESIRDKSSRYAKEGNAAHFLGEECLAKTLDPEDFRGLWIAAHGVISDDAQKPDLPGEWFEVDDEMIDGVRIYLDSVRDDLELLENAEMQIEQRVYPVEGRQDMFGTADCILIEPGGELVVHDFKYGRGMVVDVDHNDQQMYYALGALKKVLDEGDEITSVRICIDQPRAPHSDGPVRPWVIDPETLLQYEDTLRAAAEATEAPDAPLIPGPHCQKTFCPAAATCEALNRLTTEAALAALPDDLDDLGADAHVRLPDPKDPLELSRARKLVDLVEFWAKQVRQMTHDALESGMKVPGFKLAAGRQGNRDWKDPKDVERRLRNKAGVKVDEIYDSKLKSPAQMEKNPKIGKAWVKKYVTRAPGKPVVVPEESKKPAIPSMVDALTEIED